MRMAVRLIVVAVAMTVALLGTVVVQADHIQLKNATCTLNSNNSITCSGKLTGLGTAPTTVQVVADFSCTNRGGHNPPGQVSGQSAPISPSSGQITFSVTTSAGSCPDDMTPHFGRTATIEVFQGGTLVFSQSVQIT